MTEDRTSGGVEPGPRLRTAVTVLIAGILIAVPGVVVIFLTFWHAVFGPTVTVPGTEELQLGQGTYVVFEHTGNTNQYGPVTVRRDKGVTIDRQQLTVTAPDGQKIPVRNAQPNETIDRGSTRYVSAVRFTTPRSGRYALRFDTTERGDVMVRRPLGDLIVRRLPWIIDVGLGGLVTALGGILLLVGVTRRGRARRAAQRTVATATPANWFPDPQGEHRLRYWDGGTWTDNTAD